ncbi:hypothetical protein IscW_ISCW010334 [Ixodes scapularis]|uniref:Potassium channel domain-containing protein n=1 Tax=Ixodes scapularis TaxID=6945 RepID=B7Q5H0_IXOSC|nr:hypothetical protein IscW_ISCW010334 [Ixodes scapularis]|eukprot:XP_002401935.1 hypothetical protein IscW_ISCW010334 [Ixodes scapularis]
MRGGGGEPRSRCSKCRHYCRAGTTSLVSHFGLCSLVVGYCIMGAFLFEFLEAGNESNKRQEMMQWRSGLAETLWELTAASPLLDEANWTREAVARLRRFEVTLVQAVRKEGYDGKEDAQLQWSFTGALLYSIIVITTIGYGNIAPKTPQGKVVTILYAIIGIPLMLLCLSNIGDAMAQSFKFSYRYICCSICHRKAVQEARALAPPPSYKELGPSVAGPAAGIVGAGLSGAFPSPRSGPARRQADLEAARVPVISNKYALGDDSVIVSSPGAPDFRSQARRNRRAWRDDGDLADDESVNTLDDDDDEDDNEAVGSVPIWLCCGIVVGYICGGAWLFYSWEGWGYLDSAYFCFVTLTTIGFGDLVPGTALSDDQQVTLAVCAVYLLFGMALLAMSFNLVQEEVTRSVKCVGRRLGILSEDDDDR